MLLPPGPDWTPASWSPWWTTGGERTFVTSPGAEATLTAADLAAVTARPRRRRRACPATAWCTPATGPRCSAGWPGLPAAARSVFDPGPLGRVRSRPTRWTGCARRADWLSLQRARGRRADRRGQPRKRARAAALARRSRPGPACWSAPARTAACWPARVRQAEPAWPACPGSRSAAWTPTARATPTPACSSPRWRRARTPGSRGPAGQRGGRDLGDQAGTGDRADRGRAGPVPGLRIRLRIRVGPCAASPAGGREPAAAGRSPGRGAAGARTTAPARRVPRRRSRRRTSRS